MTLGYQSLRMAIIQPSVAYGFRIISLVLAQIPY